MTPADPRPARAIPPEGEGILTPLLALASLLWTGGVFLSPWLLGHGHAGAGVMLRFLYSPMCHQVPERSFFLWSAPLAACHRCSGAYAGFTLAVTAWAVAVLLRRTPRRFSLSAAVVFLLPLLCDYAGDVAGIWHNTPVSRALSGLAAGLGLGLVAAPAWDQLTAQLRAWRRSHRSKEDTHG